MAAACGDDGAAATTAAPVTIVPTGDSATVSAHTASPPKASAATAVGVTVDRGPVVRIDESEIPVELAVKWEERIRGLSGRASLDAGTGMLFVFEDASRFNFWMKEMEFSLDIVWIGPGCEVVDISVGVPPPEPGTALGDLPRYSPEAPAMYVLEINGGESSDLGIGTGDKVDFLGELAGEYGC